MAKRCADNYLTDQNWEDEEKPQTAGKFESASKEVLRNRVFKKGKRRMTSSSNSSAFKGFSGLTSSRPSTNESSNDSSSRSDLSNNSTSTYLPEDLNASSKKWTIPQKSSVYESKEAAPVKSSLKAPKVENNEQSNRWWSEGGNKESGVSWKPPSVINKQQNNSSEKNGSKQQQACRKQDSGKDEQDRFSKPSWSSNSNRYESTTSVQPEESHQNLQADSDTYVASKDGDDEYEEPDDSEEPTSYMIHLRALNRSVSKWIGEHVGSDPMCDLTPIFRDYEEHLSTIEDKYGEVTNKTEIHVEETDSSRKLDTRPAHVNLSLSSTKLEFPPSTSAELAAPTTTSTKFETPTSTITKEPSPPKFEVTRKGPLDVDVTPHSSAASPFKGFGSFGNKPAATGGFSGFPGFQFSSNMVQGAPGSGSLTQQGPTKEEEEYVPPIPASKMVQEGGSFYTKKCKLFYMKDGSYADKGVGHLHLKPVADSNKTQLIVRADTSLGNLLLNIVLNSAMPIAKQGKNNVMVSCVPNPPLDEKNPEKVVPMLIRVKTSDDADALLELLNKKKAECD